MQHESSDDELVAGQCCKFHESSVVSKSTTTAAAAVGNARLTAYCFVLFYFCSEISMDQFSSMSLKL